MVVSRISGYFPPDLQASHIGVKELYAVDAGLRAFHESLHGKHVELMVDN